MTIQQFFDKYNGKYIDFDKRYGYQCVDLMRQFIKECLVLNPYEIPAAGSAKQIYLNFKGSSSFLKIPNTPTGVPQKGDIIFWGYYPFVTGWAGHVAIFSQGDVNRFISFDQNYPTGSFCRYFNHSYNGVMGWIHRR